MPFEDEVLKQRLHCLGLFLIRPPELSALRRSRFTLEFIPEIHELHSVLKCHTPHKASTEWLFYSFIKTPDCRNALHCIDGLEKWRLYPAPDWIQLWCSHIKSRCCSELLPVGLVKENRRTLTQLLGERTQSLYPECTFCLCPSKSPMASEQEMLTLMLSAS